MRRHAAELTDSMLGDSPAPAQSRALSLGVPDWISRATLITFRYRVGLPLGLGSRRLASAPSE
jgi:hypothetical protein